MIGCGKVDATHNAQGNSVGPSMPAIAPTCRDVCKGGRVKCRYVVVHSNSSGHCWSLHWWGAAADKIRRRQKSGSAGALPWRWWLETGSRSCDSLTFACLEAQALTPEMREQCNNNNTHCCRTHAMSHNIHNSTKQCGRRIFSSHALLPLAYPRVLLLFSS